MIREEHIILFVLFLQILSLQTKHLLWITIFILQARKLQDLFLGIFLGFFLFF